MRLSRRRRRAAVPRIWEIPERGVLYVHVPKVATRSMRAALASWAEGGPEEDAIARAVERYERFARPPEIRRRPSSTFAFAFVRDPLERLYSAYADKVIGPRAKGIFARHGVRPDTNFEGFVRIVSRTSDDDCDRHLCSQHRFVCDGEGVVVDLLGSFECLEENWGDLRDRFGFPELPARNVASAGRYREAYTPELARLAADRYRTDIELFGYADRVAMLTGGTQNGIS